MSSGSFVHLHCHSHFSLLDGAAKVNDLVGQAKSQGMNALALTDHGNLYGAIEFYDACREAEINPILGYEAYVSPAHRTDRQARGGQGGEASFHLTMLATNRVGFQNLIKLSSQAFLEGFYYKPRIDKELIEAHHEGLVVLSGCAASEFSSLILGGKRNEARHLAEWFAKLFGEERFFIEIQDNGLEIQRECADGAIEIANKMGLNLVATCDTHYLCQEDSYAHEVLLCINTGKTMSDPKRMQYGSNEFYLKSAEEMYAAFPDHPQAVDQAQKIADSIDIDLDFSKRHFPVFLPPENKTDKDYLLERCKIGFEERFPNTDYPDGPTDAHWQRLDMELGVINKLGFASYFLIVWDFVQFSLDNGIPCGARGSGCGALVAYLLGFSNVDPLKYDLLFERFLDPNRKEAPDIDIDFCQERREEVIEYVRQKYGEQNVAQIITFGTMAARAVVRDVGRALEYPLATVDQIAKMIPALPKMTLEKALDQSPDLKAAYDSDSETKRLIDVGRRLEGLARNPGTHAAGVVVADEELSSIIPLQKNGEIVTTQWEMTILEQVGMLKFDFLGLRNLTILSRAVEIIQHVRGIEMDVLTIPLTDKETYDLLQRGETKGVFQLESEGIRGLLMRMKPDRFDDIIATAALYRPGPLGGGMVDQYVNVKHGREQPEYAHDVLKGILEETYGVMVYQEQVMRILNRLGGIELADAYKCIKAISKKKMEVIAKYRSQFIEGAESCGLKGSKAEEIFKLIEHFAGYGFNKSHSTAYALVAYQTAYLKAHYPAEFMAALLSSEIDKTDMLVEHIDDCRRMGIEVKPPDVNEGEVGFTVVEGVIRFGLAAIKGAGEKAIEAIVAERDKDGRYRDFFDFLERIDTKLVNKSCIEALIKAGAFDSMGVFRSQLQEALPMALQAAAFARDARSSGQGFLFDGEDEVSAEETNQSLPQIDEWSDKEKLAHEKSVLGIFLSSHPLAEHQRTLRIYRTHEIAQLDSLTDRTPVTIGGMITGVRTMIQQRGRNANKAYARFMFEDLGKSIGCVMFADSYAEWKEKIVNDSIGFLIASVDKSRDEVGLIADEWIDLEQASKRLSGTLSVRVNSAKHESDSIDQLANILKGRQGNSPVMLEVSSPEGVEAQLRVGDGFKVCLDSELMQQIEGLLGEGSVSIGPAMAPSNGNGNGHSNGNGHRRRRG
ncbi:DNA polymerase III subunit alpha [Planctomycetes bacterium Pan216]|uniref:DNA polymerase III subunit alpha n=1 Tax=Kolteria novifilia TaxID=2527975 RepID=A0A518BCX6_9BACT|nr:DNA polymerase III subunit alpha [Planctomycetes bacterium Pan216]